MAHTVVITQVYLDEHGHGVVTCRQCGVTGPLMLTESRDTVRGHTCPITCRACHHLLIRPINFPFPEFQAARRVHHLTLAVAGYPLVTLTGMSADAGFPRQRHS